MRVSKTLHNCHVLGSLLYVLEPNLYKPGAKMPNCDPRSQRRVNMDFINMH